MATIPGGANVAGGTLLADRPMMVLDGLLAVPPVMRLIGWISSIGRRDFLVVDALLGTAIPLTVIFPL